MTFEGLCITFALIIVIIHWFIYKFSSRDINISGPELLIKGATAANLPVAFILLLDSTTLFASYDLFQGALSPSWMKYWAGGFLFAMSWKATFSIE